MRKNRYLLCLLLCGLLLYSAVPRISILDQGAGRIFALSWLLLVVLAVAGNLTGFLYSPRKMKIDHKASVPEKLQKGMRSFHR